MTLQDAFQMAHNGQRMSREIWGNPPAYIIGNGQTIGLVLTDPTATPLPFVPTLEDVTADDWVTQTPPPGP